MSFFKEIHFIYLWFVNVTQKYGILTLLSKIKTRGATRS